MNSAPLNRMEQVIPAPGTFQIKPNSSRLISTFGDDLTPSDHNSLASRWISRGDAERAGLRRVDIATGRSMFGRPRGDMAGISASTRRACRESTSDGVK